MRVSTQLIYDRGVDVIQRRSAENLDTQQRLSTGRRMLSPADDPVAASRAVVTSQAQSLNAEYGTNQATARERLGLMETALAGSGDAVIEIRTLLLQGANATLGDADRRSIANELSIRLDALIGLANSRDGAGGYLFAGHSETVQPFARTATGATYAGDQGTRALQVAPTRTLQVTENGAEIFERIRAGNGTFVTGLGAANTGGAVIDQGAVVDATAVTGANYRLDFTVAGSVTTYAIVNTTTGTTLSSGNPYTSGAAITFDGMQVSVRGNPANGDTFTLAPSGNQSVFTTIADAIAALTGPSVTPADRARMDHGIQQAIGNLDQALDRILAVRTGTGARLRELDSLGDVTQTLDLQYATRLSELQDVDYAKAISDLTSGQQSLEAARASFQRISQLSLFDYL